jgi:rhamnose utilization protein RhaD (predicted bifunctional aldolase and dehydrogenase)/NAD(P)-dependent dehydrogenase (short-subunit alcohol dehydrogenase family)
VTFPKPLALLEEGQESPLQSRWNDRDLKTCMDAFAPRWGERLALRVYTSRLLGSDPDLVLHGGGNTSVKDTYRTLLGDDVDAIWVKGSGSDLDAIGPEGFPALDLTYLRRLRTREALDDGQMVNELRTHLFDAGAPNPSVETLLHAFLPHAFVDHTHADAALILTHQAPDLAREVIAEAFPGWGVVPYIMPGFKLAKLAAETYERDPAMPGLVLLNHGLFTFSDDARESYERMIAAVDRAERVGAKRARPRTLVTVGRPITEAVAETAVILRGALGAAGRRMILEHRDAEDLLRLLSSPDIETLARSGPLTPDHVLRTKPRPLVWRPSQDAKEAVLRHAADYDRYFAENAARAGRPLEKQDGLPRVVWVPEQGIFAWGATKNDARMAADIAEHTLRAKDSADAMGRYVALPEADLFDVEYWSLEQAKLGKRKEAPLGGQIAFVTGGGGAIGFAVAKSLLEAGAVVAVLDADRDRVESAVRALDAENKRVLGIVADVTDADAVARAFRETCCRFGGLDILVPCAGIALGVKLEDMDLAAFRHVIEVNLTGTMTILREAGRLFRRQGLGGNVVLVSTKNVFAPGAQFGAYSSSKAGEHQLARVAALEWAEMGVRVNMISVDAVFGEASRPSGLWQEVGLDRARAHGVDPSELPEFYRRRNLLKTRVTGDDVGRAVVFFASNQTPTTGATLTVDGGLPEATPR